MSDYPVHLTVPNDPGQNRLWGLLWFGMFVRAIVVIPHLIILFFVGIGAWLLTFVSWIPVLLNGRMASWGYQVIGGYLRLSARASLYVVLATGAYPPFWTGDHAVSVEFDENEEQNRLWGIPIFGILVRVILLIPHFIVLWILGIAAAFVVVFAWVPVLVNGRQADSVVRFLSAYYRWALRVSAYTLLLTGRYPPFSLDD
jgi:hypothetical protein